MERNRQLMEAAEQSKRNLIQYWCEVAALNATEAGTLFGYGRYREARKCLMKAQYASDQVKKITTPKKIDNGDDE